jgi:hypothetical protein
VEPSYEKTNLVSPLSILSFALVPFFVMDYSEMFTLMKWRTLVIIDIFATRCNEEGTGRNAHGILKTC